MKIFNRNGTAYVRLNGVRTSLQVPFTPLSGAQAALVKILANPAVKPNGTTLKQAAKEAQATHYKGGIGERQQVASKVREMLDFWGDDVLLESIKTRSVDAFKAHLTANGNTGATINRKLAVLSKITNLAVEWELIQSGPNIKRERESKGRIRWITEAEELAVVSHWKQDQPMLDYFVVMLDTGLRPSELRMILPAHVDDGVLNVWKVLGQKQGTRAIPLTSRVAPIMARLCAGADPSVPLFGWLTEDRLVQQWDKMRTAIGVSDPLFVSYTTRHTFAVRMLEAEVDVFTLKDLMGHAKIETTLRYAHVTGRLKRGAVAKMERRISENGVSKSESLLPEKQPSLESDSGSVVANSLIRKAHDLQPIRGFAFNSPSLYRLSYQGIAA